MDGILTRMKGRYFYLSTEFIHIYKHYTRSLYEFLFFERLKISSRSFKTVGLETLLMERRVIVFINNFGLIPGYSFLQARRLNYGSRYPFTGLRDHNQTHHTR